MEQRRYHHPHGKHGRKRRHRHVYQNKEGYSPDDRRQYKQIRTGLIFVLIVFLVIVAIVILSVSGPDAWRRWLK